jgi:hypothetical protein
VARSVPGDLHHTQERTVDEQEADVQEARASRNTRPRGCRNSNRDGPRTDHTAPDADADVVDLYTSGLIFELLPPIPYSKTFRPIPPSSRKR